MTEENPSMTELFGPVISSYSEAEAVEDGILFDLTQLKTVKNNRTFSHLTVGLMEAHKYLIYNKRPTGDEITINEPAIIDLMAQCLNHMIEKRKTDKITDSFYATMVEGPNGNKFKVFIEQNSTGRYTILLPSEH